MEQHFPTHVIRDIPWLRWFFGLVLSGVAVSIVLVTLVQVLPLRRAPDNTFTFVVMLVVAMFGLGGLLLFSLASVLSIRADRARGFLTLTYRSLLRKTVKEIPLHQIASIDIEVYRGQSPSYRVVITESDGQVTPLRYYSPGNKKDLANRLRELTGVGGSAIFVRDPQYMALIAPYAEMRETSGVCWNVQSIDMGGVPVTRWFSPDCKTKATFVYIVQKPASQKSYRGLIGRAAMRVSMARYGFGGEDAPGSEEGEMLVLDRRLDREFMAFSPDPSAACRILNPRVVELLDDWAERHPLKMIQVVGKSLGQLVVHYSPNGVYAATIQVGDSSQLEELIDTGLQLVKAQRRSSS
jgi:hypothetical protein